MNAALRPLVEADGQVGQPRALNLWVIASRVASAASTTTGSSSSPFFALGKSMSTTMILGASL